MSSLCKSHANLLCIAPNLVDMLPKWTQLPIFFKKEHILFEKINLSDQHIMISEKLKSVTFAQEYIHMLMEWELLVINPGRDGLFIYNHFTMY